jgi:LysM repeat protein
MDSDDMIAEPEKKKYKNGTVEYWTEDDVKWTDEGIASLGLYAQQMEIAEYQSKQYAKAIDDLNQDYKAGKYSEIDYLEKLNELKYAQYDSIEAYYDAQDAIKDLNETRIDSIKEGIEKEIEAYEELIEKKKEELSAEKDLYDFQKSVQESSKNIADIQRKIAALSGDNSASAVATRKKLEAELIEAQAEQEELYYERSIENQQNALDKELEDFQKEKDAEIEKWDEYLTNVETVVADSLGIIQANAFGVYDTLNAKAQEYNLTLSDSIMTPWTDGALAVSDYQATFDTAMSSTMDQLEALKNKWQEVIDKMAETGRTNVADINKENSRYTSAAPAPAPAPAKPATNTTNKTNQSSPQYATYTVKSGDTLSGIASSQLGSASKWNDIYNLNRDILSNPDLIYPGQKLKLPKYAKGTLSAKENQLAILDELGDELQLVPDGQGRLAYIKKGTSIVPADITERLMNIAMNPQEMIEQNRPQIGVPHITNNEINISMDIAEVVHIDKVTNDTIPDLTKAIEKQMDSYMAKLNNSLKRYTR